jgi:hypothetical protein
MFHTLFLHVVFTANVIGALHLVYLKTVVATYIIDALHLY